MSLPSLQNIPAPSKPIPITIITGFGNEEAAIGALRSGAGNYLKKPLQVDELRRVIASQLRSAQRERAVRATGESSPGEQTRDAPSRESRSARAAWPSPKPANATPARCRAIGSGRRQRPPRIWSPSGPIFIG